MYMVKEFALTIDSNDSLKLPEFSDDVFEPRKRSKTKSIATSSKPSSIDVKSRKVPVCRKKEQEKAKSIQKYVDESVSNPSFEIVHVSLKFQCSFSTNELSH